METNLVSTMPEVGSSERSVSVPGLIFIPDISGFTRFVHEVDVSVGSYVTYELLSTIIEENHLRLCISEIEGDAVFFYRYGPPP